jgi:hypothetical protein
MLCVCFAYGLFISFNTPNKLYFYLVKISGDKIKGAKGSKIAALIVLVIGFKMVLRNLICF